MGGGPGAASVGCRQATEDDWARTGARRATGRTALNYPVDPFRCPGSHPAAAVRGPARNR